MNLTRRLPRLLSKGRGGRRNGRHQWHPAPRTTERSYRREGCGTSNPLDDYGPPQVGSPVSAIVVGSPCLVSFQPQGKPHDGRSGQERPKTPHIRGLYLGGDMFFELHQYRILHGKRDEWVKVHGRDPGRSRTSRRE